jgi:AcrR family transcriptional regulator
MTIRSSEDSLPPRQHRLSRAETRRRILAAAARVFARRGLEAASLDEVAAVAGFSKGAVYSNFASKEDLVLELMEQAITTRVERVSAALSGTPNPAGRSQEAGRLLTEALRQEPEWQVLFIEFWLLAVRDASLRERFASRRAPLRARIARLIEQQAAETGLALPAPAEQLAVAVLALSNGLGIEQMADPSAVPPDAFGLFLALLFHGLSAGPDS